MKGLVSSWLRKMHLTHLYRPFTFSGSPVDIRHCLKPFLREFLRLLGTELTYSSSPTPYFLGSCLSVGCSKPYFFFKQRIRIVCTKALIIGKGFEKRVSGPSRNLCLLQGLIKHVEYNDKNNDK